MERTDLKKCPFCGGKAEVCVVSDKVFHVYKKFRNRYLFAGCRECGIVTSLYAMNNHTGSPNMNIANKKRAEKRAIEAWNRRVNDGTYREQIVNEIQSLIKALKDCGGWVKRGNGEGWFNHEILADALSIIKELTEENERLAKHNAVLIEDNHILATEFKKITIADTVREMKERLEANMKTNVLGQKFIILSNEDIDQIAKEMAEGV